MVDRGGGTNGDAPIPPFSRGELRDAGCSVRAEHERINPHAFYRVLWERTTELRGHQPSDGFAVDGRRSRDLRVENPTVGDRTGVVTGRLQAQADRPVGDAVVAYRPWGPHGALAIVIGFIVLPLAILNTAFIGLAGALASIGLLAFSRMRDGQVPLRCEDVLSVLIQGEARENVRWTEQGQRSELAADLGVVYAGDTFLAVEEDRIPELGWPLRSELVLRADRWQISLKADPAEQTEEEGVSMGFFDALEAWFDRDASASRRQLRSIQRNLRDPRAARRAHARRLSRLRDADVHDRELERLEREIQALDTEMQAYVDHRGVPPLAGEPIHRRPPGTRTRPRGEGR